ncbi:hypothetical protein GMDG_02289 [Pseudogymnoascus destructans 20631-21]|uniref:Uncharacterized protein n=2 Tax=Pseudogymnoascus destructans TaxID=655981 RepID=L8G282_PSED2|nr:hypothetical protein GMDG_02289 [Pseudogymnoascus destructans 20631-21]
MTYIFAVNLEWKSIPLPKSDEAIETAETKTTANGKPQLLGKLNLEITLNTSVANSLTGWLPNWPSPNEHYLSEAAFRTRSFTAAIEKGNFIPNLWVGYEGKFKQRWGLRLLFDKSPYPTREGLKSLDEVPISVDELDEMVTFLARRLPDSETRGKAMNDDSYAGFRGSCSVS